MRKLPVSWQHHWTDDADHCVCISWYTFHLFLWLQWLFFRETHCSLLTCSHCTYVNNLSKCVLIQPLSYSKCKLQFLLFRLLPWVFRNKGGKIHKHHFLWEGSISTCQHGSFTGDCLGLEMYKKYLVEACFLNVTKCKTSILWTT